MKTELKMQQQEAESNVQESTEKIKTQEMQVTKLDLTL